MAASARWLEGWPRSPCTTPASPPASELALEAADLADAEAEQPGRLGLGSLPALDGVQDLEDIAFPLAHGYPV